MLSSKQYLLLKWMPIILFAFFVVAYIVPLGARPMIVPDEFRYAEIPREMIENNNWVVPTLADAVYFEKPALGYQLTALSFKIFGENAFALRLPSALATGLASIFIYYLAQRMRRRENDFVPGFASAIYLTFGIVFGIGTFAVLDAQLAAALTFTIGAFYLAWETKKTKWLIAAGVGAGIAFLLKGLLAFVVPALVAVSFLVWQKDWKRIFTMPWIPLIFALIVIAPWAYMIHKAEPSFWEYFIVEEHWNRFFTETYDRKPEPFWYFIPVLAGGMMPPGLLICVSWMGWTKKFFSLPSSRFILLWFAVPFVFFSISSCKLGTYILPCFPPLAMLIAFGFSNAIELQQEKAEKIISIFFKIFAALMVTVSGAAIGVLLFLPMLKNASILLYVAVLLVAVWGIATQLAKRTDMKIAIFLAGLAPSIVFGLYGLEGNYFKDKAAGYAISELLAESPLRENDTILVDRKFISVVPWITKKSDVTVVWRPGELQYAFTKHPERFASRWIEKESDLPERFEGTEDGSRVFFFSRNLKKYPIPENWPKGELKSVNGIYMLRF